jgi:hypothetical protein
MPLLRPSWLAQRRRPLSPTLPSSKAEEWKALPPWSLSVAWEAQPLRRTPGEHAFCRSPGPVLRVRRALALVHKEWKEERTTERQYSIASTRFHEA